MVDSRQWMGPLVVVVLILAAAYLIAYPLIPTRTGSTTTITQVQAGLSSSARPYTVNIAYKAGVGFYLVNGSGFALYFRTNDPGNGSSTCTGSCVTFWPLFHAAGPLSLPPNLDESDFGNATRSDGKLQTTYYGYPLYYFINDKAPGQVSGQGKNDFYACCSIVSVSSTSTTSSTG
jgi:predicted lipoprotein with Yx(FWY)xxD motif